MFDTRTYSLNNEAIQEAVTDIEPFLQREKLEKQNLLRLCLTLEELLLRVKDSGIEYDSFSLSIDHRFGKKSILLRYKGGNFDPTYSPDEDETWQSKILSNLGLSPTWSYRSGVNKVKLSLPKSGETNTLMSLFIAVIAAAIVGIIGNYFPKGLCSAFDTYLLTPLFNAFLGLLSTLAGLMIFLTVTSGVFGIGDTASLNRIGKTTLSRFVMTAFIAASVAVITTLPFMPLHMDSESRGESQIAGVCDMIFNILPNNLIRPYLEGNTMQIIVIAVFTGVVILSLGEKMRTICALIIDIGTLVQTMIGIICRLIPLFVFVSLTKQIWSGAAGTLLNLWKPVCVFLLAAVTIIFLVLLTTVTRTKISPVQLIKKTFPAFLIAFSTASSMAAFSTSKKNCVEQLGINKKLFDFAFPVGMVTYMPAPAVEFTVVSIFLAKQYGVEVSVSWYIMAGFLAAVLSIAVPPMPGAGLTCYGLLLAQLKIPEEAMLMAVTLNIIFDFFCSGIDTLMLQLELLYQADVLKMLDREKLEYRC